MSNNQDEYIVSLEQFEGPLDLLHQLVEKRKLQINTIALAQVTADYMAHLRTVAAVSAEEVSRFMHIASILILIKSKSLLPILDYTKEEEVDVAELEDRIKIFDYIRTRAVPVLDTWRKRAYGVMAPTHTESPVFHPDNSCTGAGLQYNATVALQRLSFLREPPRKKVGAKVRIEKIIENVLSVISERISVSFRKLSEKADKQEKIVSFLAVLELMRKNLLTATQQDDFGDIMITKNNPQLETTTPDV